MRWAGIVVLVFLVLLIGAGVGSWLWLRAPDLSYSELESRYAGKNAHFVDLNGGIRLHYEDEGRGPVIVLVHGFGDNWGSWDGWAAALKNRYRVIRIDLPGHGLTRAPASTPIDPEAFADVIDEFANKIGLPKFAVAGNSLGGAVAWEVAVRHPERLNALILVDAAGFPSATLTKPPLAFRILQYQWGRALLKTIDNKPLIRDSLNGEVGNPAVITDALVNRWADVQRAPGHRDILLSGPLTGKGAASEAALGKLSLPTLVLWGEKDPLITLDAGKKFAAAIPGAKLKVYPGIGHLPQIEIPAASAHDVAAFLATIAF
jgi:Predicted hydrolases or acyltransferases (alpha/beta hydrolase superfamily)